MKRVFFLFSPLKMSFHQQKKLPNGVFRSVRIFDVVCGVLRSTCLSSPFMFGVLLIDGEPKVFESKSLCVNRGISISKLCSSSGFFFTVLGSSNSVSSSMSSYCCVNNFRPVFFFGFLKNRNSIISNTKMIAKFKNEC